MLCLNFFNLELSEYDYYLNNFKHSFYEELFSKIDQAATNNNIEELKDIAWQCEQIGEHLIALCAKARLEKLPENEVVELSSFILGIEIFSFYELLILSDTIEQFSSEMIKAIIQDLSHHHQRLANRTRYRKNYLSNRLSRSSDLYPRRERKGSAKNVWLWSKHIVMKKTHILD